jgi:hypothetical protein
MIYMMSTRALNNSAVLGRDAKRRVNKSKKLPPNPRGANGKDYHRIESGRGALGHIYRE